MNPMFPKLTAAQLARLLPIGRRRRFAAGEVVYERGSAKRAFYVLLDGRVEIATPSRVGDVRITIHGVGEFTGRGRHDLRAPQPRPGEAPSRRASCSRSTWPTSGTSCRPTPS